MNLTVAAFDFKRIKKNFVRVDKERRLWCNPQQLAAVNTLMAEDAAESGGPKGPPIIFAQLHFEMKYPSRAFATRSVFLTTTLIL